MTRTATPFFPTTRAPAALRLALLADRWATPEDGVPALWGRRIPVAADDRDF